MSGFQRMMQLGRTLGLDEKGARLFAEGRDGPTAERQWAAIEAREAVRTAQAAAAAGAKTGVQAVAESAQTVLGMSPVEARSFATRLQEREVSKGGPEHAGTWMNLFAQTLRTTAATR